MRFSRSNRPPGTHERSPSAHRCFAQGELILPLESSGRLEEYRLEAERQDLPGEAISFAHRMLSDHRHYDVIAWLSLLSFNLRTVGQDQPDAL